MARSNRIRWSWPAAAAVLLASAGCGSAYAPTGVDVAVRRPPPRRVEVVSVAPGTGYVWIPGHYAWRANDYLWMPGRWETPPQPRYRSWVAGRWVRTRSGWYWVEGHWR